MFRIKLYEDRLLLSKLEFKKEDQKKPNRWVKIIKSFAICIQMKRNTLYKFKWNTTNGTWNATNEQWKANWKNGLQHTHGSQQKTEIGTHQYGKMIKIETQQKTLKLNGIWNLKHMQLDWEKHKWDQKFNV